MSLVSRVPLQMCSTMMAMASLQMSSRLRTRIISPVKPDGPAAEPLAARRINLRNSLLLEAMTMSGLSAGGCGRSAGLGPWGCSAWSLGIVSAGSARIGTGAWVRDFAARLMWPAAVSAMAFLILWVMTSAGGSGRTMGRMSGTAGAIDSELACCLTCSALNCFLIEPGPPELRLTDGTTRVRDTCSSKRTTLCTSSGLLL